MSRAERAPGDDTAAAVVAVDEVRWSDVDPLGIIRYDTYVRLLEIGETALFRALGIPHSAALDPAVRDAVWLPRRRLEFEYLTPARLGDRIEVRSRVRAAGTTSLTLAFEFADHATGALRATATMVVVSVDRGTLAKRPLPDALRAAIHDPR